MLYIVMLQTKYTVISLDNSNGSSIKVGGAEPHHIKYSSLSTKVNLHEVLIQHSIHATEILMTSFG